MKYDVHVYLMDFPGRTKEAVCPNEDGSFTLFINAKLSYERQLEAYKHALFHIQSQDFEKNDVQKLNDFQKIGSPHLIRIMKSMKAWLCHVFLCLCGNMYNNLGIN